MIARVQASRLFGVAALASTLLASACAPQAQAGVAQSNGVAETISPTDLRISQLQDHLRADPHDARGATTLGLAYLQRARETSDPTYLSRADGLFHQALAIDPHDADTLTGLG